MPEDQKFTPLKELLSPQEMYSIVQNLMQYGLEEVRITGGEPLLHPQFNQIVTELSKLPLKKLALTTNAIKLHEKLDFLVGQNLKHINISCDSLNENSFAYLTKSNQFEAVISNILLAKEMGFHIKLNTVLMKNINFEEIESFLNFSSKHDIEVRFLELMKIGHAQHSFERHFVSADEAITKLKQNWSLETIHMPADSTSFNFIASQNRQKAKIGFIASESKPFCNGCSRLRLSNQGVLKPCIMINEGPNLKDLSLKQYDKTLEKLIANKPNYRIEKNDLTMNEIGG
jgi:cyclic pyranopterin phosphate synthase